MTDEAEAYRLSCSCTVLSLVSFFLCGVFAPSADWVLVMVLLAGMGVLFLLEGAHWAVLSRRRGMIVLSALSVIAFTVVVTWGAMSVVSRW